MTGLGLYLKLGAALVLVGGLASAGWVVSGWRNDARKVPGLEQELAEVRGMATSLNAAVSECERQVLAQNAAVARWHEAANTARVDAAEAALRARAIDEAWRKRWAALPPPPPDCCGALGWLVEHAPDGWWDAS